MYIPPISLQTIINSALAWDAYFQWYYALVDSVPFMCEMDLREARAFDNMNKAIDMHEAYERISINNHKSFIPHLAIFKVCSRARCPRARCRAAAAPTAALAPPPHPLRLRAPDARPRPSRGVAASHAGSH